MSQINSRLLAAKASRLSSSSADKDDSCDDDHVRGSHMRELLAETAIARSTKERAVPCSEARVRSSSDFQKILEQPSEENDFRKGTWVACFWCQTIDGPPPSTDILRLAFKRREVINPSLKTFDIAANRV